MHVSKRKELTSREDVYLLVSIFYTKIKKDTFIGPFFLKAISEDEWEGHLQKLTDFWQTNLFSAKTYKGNPMQVHKQLDVANNYVITQEHFGKWLELWVATIRELFYGEKAEKAIKNARNIASLLFIRIFENRKRT